MRLLPQKVAYRGTVTGLTISSVAGTAFVDNLPAEILALPLDGTMSLEVYDSAGRFIRGVLRAVGTGETVDATKITGWTNQGTHPFETWGTTGAEIDSAINTTGLGIADTNIIALTDGGLYKLSTSITLNSGTVPKWLFANTDNGGGVSIPDGGVGIDLAEGANNIYVTDITDTINYLLFYVENGVATNFSTASTTLKQVLTPSASGATIVSAKGGATYNFQYQHPSFVWNAASYYCLVRALRG